MDSALAQTKEKRNGTKLRILLIDGGTRVLKDIFDGFHPPKKLEEALNDIENRRELDKLRRRIIKQEQWNQLYPALGPPSSNNFDITLLSLLLRTICDFSAPGTGWTDEPNTSDRSPEANSVRLRLYRNELNHAATTEVSDADFESKWEAISKVLAELGFDKDEMKRLKSEPIDNAACYDDQIKMWVDSDRFLELEKRVEALENKPVKKPLRSIIHEPPEGIIGRAELIEKISSICDQEKPVSVLLTGGPGFGKTSLALKVCSNLVKRERKVIFCNLRSDICSGEDIANAVMSVIDEDKVQKDPAHALRSWAKELEERVLLVLDNVEDALETDDCRKAFHKLLTDLQAYSSRKVSYLITSRTTFKVDILMEFFELQPLLPKEGIEIITAACSSRKNSIEVTEEGKKKLAELCGNVPLALCIAGALLCDFSELEVIEGMEENIIEMLVDSEQLEDKHASIKQAISLSFNKLDPDLQKLFVQLTVFSGPFTAKAVTQVTNQNSIKAIKALRRRCLLEKHGGRYSIHRLIHAFLQDYGEANAKDDLREGKNNFLKYYTSSLFKNSKLYWTKDSCRESLSEFIEDRDNFEQALRMSCHAMNEENESFQISVMEVWTRYGCFEEARNVALYIESCVSLRLYLETLNCFLQIAEKSKLLCPQLELLCLLGHEMRRKGDKDGYEKRIKEADTMYNENKSQLFDQKLSVNAYYLTAKGRYYGSKNERQKALNAFKEVVEFCESHKSTDLTLDLAKAVLELGHNEKNSKQGDKKLALEKHEKALQMYEKQLGKHMLTAFALKDLADCHLFYREYDEALSTYKKAEKMFNSFENYFAEKDLISFMKNFAMCYKKLDCYDESLHYYQKAKDTAERELEGYHKLKVWVSIEMAYLYDKMEKKELAFKLADEALTMGHEMKLSTDEWISHQETLNDIVIRNKSEH